MRWCRLAAIRGRWCRIRISRGRRCRAMFSRRRSAIYDVVRVNAMPYGMSSIVLQDRDQEAD